MIPLKLATASQEVLLGRFVDATDGDTEETGLTIDVGPIVEVLDRISRDADGRVEHHFVLVDFVCRPSGGVLRGASDADDAAWIALTDLARYGVAAVTVGVIRKAVSRGFETGDRPLVW